MSITNNTAPFMSIIWHQKEHLGCVVSSHCPTNDSCNKYVHSCCLPCNYVTKPFGILQRVIKSQKVCISFGHSKSWYLSSRKSLWLSFKLVFKFSGLMKGNYLKKFSPYQCTFSKKKLFLLCPYYKMYSYFRLRIGFFSYFVA